MDLCGTAGEELQNGKQVYENIKKENVYITSYICDPDVAEELLDSRRTETCINEYDTSFVVCKEEFLGNFIENGVVNNNIPDPFVSATHLRNENSDHIEKIECMKARSNNDSVLSGNSTKQTHANCTQVKSEIQEECARVLASHLAKISAVTQKTREWSVQQKQRNKRKATNENGVNSKFYIIGEHTVKGIQDVHGLTSLDESLDNIKKTLESNKASYKLRYKKFREIVPSETIIQPNKVITRSTTTQNVINENKIELSKYPLRNKIKIVTSKRKSNQNESLTRNSNNKKEVIIEKKKIPITDNTVGSEIENIDRKNKPVRKKKLNNSNKQNVETVYNGLSSKRAICLRNEKMEPAVKRANVIHKKSIRKIKTSTINKQNVLPAVEQKIMNQNKLFKKLKSKTEKSVSVRSKLGTNNKSSTKIILKSKKHKAKSKRKLPANENIIKINVKSTANMTPEFVFQNKYICDICGHRTKTKKYIEHHIKKHNEQKVILSCDNCSYMTDTKNLLYKHMWRHTGEKRFSCAICAKKFSRKDHLDGHMKTHTGEKPYSCDLCSYRCSRKSLLDPHMVTHTGVKPFSCTFCSFKCARKESVTAHMKAHTGERRYHCEICSFRFVRKQCLINHMMMHNKEKPFACKHCKYTCIRKVDLVVHERKHTGERPYSCKLCAFKSTRNITLIYHMRTHTDERPFACELCNYKGRQGHNLIVHMRTHTGEKPFHCKKCNYRCTDKSSLNKHTRVHTQEKPYVCEHCNSRFKDRGSHKRHVISHSSEKKFWCGLCQFKCVRKNDLVNHMKRHDKKLTNILKDI